MSQGFFAQFRGTAPNNNASSSFSSDITAEMPSRKRSREADDVDGDVEIESASSSFRQTQPKRSRVALAAENGGSVISDDEDDDETIGYGAGSGFIEGGPNPSEDEDEDDEIDEMRATQIVQKQIKEHRDNIASEQGVIEEVFCRNFMCHSKLRIKLGPLINFIIGHNGSGKSAVLTALTMCLGGSAKVTNRGASLKSLIKEGEESATLAVKIKNQGDGAYKPELYGRSITVERHFSRGGTSGFKLKNAEDKVISSKKSDLDDILDFFAFQLDNPINVLTQDMARQFLSNSTPTDKYKFFIRGTQLETLDHDYKIIEEHYDNMLAKLTSREEDVTILKGKTEEAERKKKQVDQVRTLHARIHKMHGQHAWLQVGEQEQLLDDLERQFEEGGEQVKEKEQEAETYSGTYDGHNQAAEAAERTIAQLKEQLPPIQVDHDGHKERFAANLVELKKVHADQRIIKDDSKKHRETIKSLTARVKEEQDRIAGAEGAEHAERLTRLEELKITAEQAKTEQTEHSVGSPDLQSIRQEALQAYEASKPDLDRQKDELERTQTYLASLQRSQGQTFEGYVNNMDQLVRAVASETRWRYKPVGPMGKHCRLLKPEWSSLLEKTFASVLEGFVVTNAEDQKLLRSIMQRVRCNVTIFMGDPTPLSPIHEPEADIDTILRVLQIDNDLVRNQLIINTAVEQVCLIGDTTQAVDYLYGPTRPQHVKAAICQLDGRGKGVRYEYSRTGAEKSTTLQGWTGRPRMTTDHAEQIRIQEEIVKQARRDVDQVKQRIRERQMALEKAGQDIKRFERDAKDYKTRAQQAEDAVEEQTNAIESLRPQDGRLQELERQLRDEKEALEGVNSSYQDAVNSKDALSKSSEDLKQKLDAAQQQLDDANARVERAQVQGQRANTARQEALLEKNQALQAIDVAKNWVQVVEGRRDDQKQKVDEFIEMATRISRRVSVEEGLTPQILDARIEKLTKDMERQEREAGGTREELTLAWSKAKQEYEEARSQMDQMKRLAQVRMYDYTQNARLGLIIFTVVVEYSREPTITMEAFPALDHCACAHQLQLPAQRAQFPRQCYHGPRGQTARHLGRAGSLEGVQ